MMDYEVDHKQSTCREKAPRSRLFLAQTNGVWGAAQTLSGTLTLARLGQS